MINIVVIDGQGGRLGKLLVEAVKDRIPQAEVLAVCLGKRLGIPVGSGMLIRDKKTKPQKELSAADRLKNLSGAFRAGTIPEGIKTVLLVDDIYTTGSTVEACARALRSAGVSRVYFVVICMTGGR